MTRLSTLSKTPQNGNGSHTPALPTYISLTQATKLTGLDKKKLSARIEAGTITAITLNGEIAVNVADVKRTVPKEELPEYKQFKKLDGKAIGINEAAKEYAVPFSTLRGWVEHNYVRVIERQNNKVLLNEADVAYCVLVYERNKGQGKRTFNPDGTPYTPKRQAIR